MVKKKSDAYYSPLFVKASEYLFHTKKDTVFAKIAIGIIDKIEEFPLVNIEELALYCETTPSSITKFCYLLDYNSFTELKNDILAYTPHHVDLSIVTEEEILHEIHSYIPLSACEAFGGKLALSSKVMIATNEFTFNVANTLKEHLSCSQRKVYLVERTNNVLIKNLMNTVDSLIILTFTGDWMDKHSWCHVIPPHVNLFLISMKIPTCMQGREINFISLKEYPRLFTSNYHSHKFLESLAFQIIKFVN